MEGLYLSAGLGTPQYSPGRAGGSGWGEGCLGFSAEAAAGEVLQCFLSYLL